MPIQMEISQNYKKWYHVEERKNIMYLLMGWGGGILCVLFYAYDYITLTYIAFFFAVAGFVVHHKESNK
jgi:hypothetical protein